MASKAALFSALAYGWGDPASREEERRFHRWAFSAAQPSPFQRAQPATPSAAVRMITHASAVGGATVWGSELPTAGAGFRFAHARSPSWCELCAFDSAILRAVVVSTALAPAVSEHLANNAPLPGFLAEWARATAFQRPPPHPRVELRSGALVPGFVLPAGAMHVAPASMPTQSITASWSTAGGGDPAGWYYRDKRGSSEEQATPRIAAGGGLRSWLKQL